jgi:hypothetical protein
MARLTYRARKHLKRSTYATPPTAAAKKRGAKGSFPIPDAAHARDALARSANKSPAIRAAVRRAVHKHFPGIKISKKK